MTSSRNTNGYSPGMISNEDEREYQRERRRRERRIEEKKRKRQDFEKHIHRQKNFDDYDDDEFLDTYWDVESDI